MNIKPKKNTLRKVSQLTGFNASTLARWRNGESGIEKQNLYYFLMDFAHAIENYPKDEE